MSCVTTARSRDINIIFIKKLIIYLLFHTNKKVGINLVMKSSTDEKLMQMLFDYNLGNASHAQNIIWLSRHHLLTIQIVISHPSVLWNMDAVSLNPSITMNVVVAHPDLNWNWALLTHNPDFNIETYKRFSDKPWDFQRIAMMRDVTGLDIYANANCREYAFLTKPEDLNFENMDHSNMEGFGFN